MTGYDDTQDAPDLTASYVLERVWMGQAPCAYSPDPDAWWPDNDHTPGVTEAVDVCRFRCPVWEECAAYAIATEQCGGIAAGLLLGDAKCLDTNATRLRDQLAGSDLQPDLLELLDQVAQARQRRRQATKHPQRAKLADPQRLRDLLTEYAPVRLVDGREVA